jgi:uncharacterized protein YqjF (DUF2071 family)
MNPNRAFLTAEWRYLAMLNYEVDPALVQPFVPNGAELDFHRGKTYVSMVGFHFVHTRVLGISIPFHADFEEVNLRLYVRHNEGGVWRRGVTFVRELVPRWAIATTAKLAYNEAYLAVPMSHEFEFDPATGDPRRVEYSWRLGRRSNRIEVHCEGGPLPLAAGSHEQFIAEHYWGYTAQRDGGTVEYRVEHPPWRMWQVHDPVLETDIERLYGRQFANVLSGPPSSAFLAEGSAITVYQPRRL